MQPHESNIVAFSLAIFLLFTQSDNISLRDLRSDLGLLHRNSINFNHIPVKILN